MSVGNSVDENLRAIVEDNAEGIDEMRVIFIVVSVPYLIILAKPLGILGFIVGVIVIICPGCFLLLPGFLLIALCFVHLVVGVVGIVSYHSYDHVVYIDNAIKQASVGKALVRAQLKKGGNKVSNQ